MTIDLNLIDDDSLLIDKKVSHVNLNPQDEVAVERIEKIRQNFLTPKFNEHIAKAPKDIRKIPSLNNEVIDQFEDYKQNLDTLLQDQQIENKLDYPFVALAALEFGLAKEAESNKKIHAYIEEVEQNHKQIDKLLKLSTKLSQQKETEPVSQEIKDLLADLQESGIDLIDLNENMVSKEKLGEIKSLASSQIDKLRSNTQILFSTKIQVQMQAVSSIMDILKDIIRNNSRLIEKTNRLPGH